MGFDMKRVVLALILCATAERPAMAQVGVIIIPKEPEQAQELARRAGQLLRASRKALEAGPLDPSRKANLEARIQQLLQEGRTIRKKSRGGLPLTPHEQSVIDTSLHKVKLVCSWLSKNALGEPAATRPGPASPTPARAGPSPR